MPVPSASVDDAVDSNGAEDDSKPLDFDTYVPTYDPSLETSPLSASSINEIDITAISQDEAFSRAMNAMYWTGYWTAIYHVRYYGRFSAKIDVLYKGHRQNQTDDAE